MKQGGAKSFLCKGTISVDDGDDGREATKSRKCRLLAVYDLLGRYSFLCKSSAQLLRTKSAGSCHKIGFASEDFSSVILVNM
jgi:hypothetical protein